MSYTGEALQEYPVTLEEGIPKGDDGEIVFLCRSEDDGVIAPPTPASAHVEEWVENIQYNSRVSVHKRNMAEQASIESAQKLGYILSIPSEIGFSRYHLDDDAPEWAAQPTAANIAENYLREISAPPQTQLDYPTYHLSTRWAVDVPEGYSILVTTPFFKKKDTYSVVPYVIDADAGLSWINVTLVLHESSIRIQYGDPVIQVIPLKHESMNMNAVIDRSVENDG